MNRFLKTKNFAYCCGCSACEKSCPTSCIDMVKTSEGFLYPEIKDENKCVDCSLCSEVCPFEDKMSSMNDEVLAFAGYTRDENMVLNCSSGGIFPVLAKSFLENGIVYGAYLNNEHKLIHIGIDSNSDLHKLMGSKYIQSDIQNVFSECKNNLQNGKKVLFTGTPCQISGLKKYLKKDYENLYTADVICHGVPSQKMFDNYVEFLEKKHKAKLVDINFRDKKRNGWSITLRYTMENFKNRKKDYYLISPLSEYFSGFLNGFFLRESCYECPFASLERPSDITLGDFWGYQKSHPELRNDEGLSLILVNTQKGRQMLETLKNNGVVLNKISENDIKISENKNLYNPSARPKMRDVIYSELDDYGFEYVANKYFRKNATLKNKIKNRIPKKYVDLVKKKNY